MPWPLQCHYSVPPVELSGQLRNSNGFHRQFNLFYHSLCCCSFCANSWAQTMHLVHVTQVKHSIHKLRTFLRICADPSMQMFWIYITIPASDTFLMFFSISFFTIPSTPTTTGITTVFIICHILCICSSRSFYFLFFSIIIVVIINIIVISNSNWTKWSTIRNSNWTEWSTIQGVIVQVISNLDKCEADLNLQARLLSLIIWHKVQLLIVTIAKFEKNMTVV